MSIRVFSCAGSGEVEIENKDASEEDNGEGETTETLSSSSNESEGVRSSAGDTVEEDEGAKQASMELTLERQVRYIL